MFSVPLDVKVAKYSLNLEITFYVIGVLLHQGFTVLIHFCINKRNSLRHLTFTGLAYKLSKKMAIRIVVITWGISALLLINYYNSLCVSFLTVPIKNPLIQSIQELRDHTEIQLVMDKNRNVQSILLVFQFSISNDIL